MLSPKTQRNLYRIIPFGLIWFVFSMVFILMEKGLLGDATHYPSTGNVYDFSSNILIAGTTALFAGLIMGTIEALYLSKVFAKRSYFIKIIYKTVVYLVVMISFLIFNGIIGNALRLDLPMFDKQVLGELWAFLTNFAFWSIEIYIAVIIGVSLFYAEVSDNLGQGVLANFFTGKYHTPVEEERIFMFLDMKSSTTIAEKLGHVQYFEMLKEYYSDLSEPIIVYSGEIYQYVGDEVIVSWKLDKGLIGNNFIACFYAMKQAVEKQTMKYEQQFGVVPTFKAGFHYGKVTTGEIGVIKKEIIFTGDVLNTTARIQGLCNDYEVDNLISAQLVTIMNASTELEMKPLGESELRGRDEKVTLFTAQASS
jgi:adenylate cyclase